MSDGWHIATLKPGKGDLACERLQADGFELWRPMHWVWRQKRGTRTREKVERPCLPAYLFIALTPRICAIQRVSCGYAVPLAVNDTPVAIPDKALDPMRRLLAHAGDVDRSKELVQLVKGEMLRLLAGPFIGFSARFEANERHGQIRVAVEAFGRATTVHTHIADVERIG